MDMMMGAFQSTGERVRPDAYAFTAPPPAATSEIHGFIELTSKCSVTILRELIRAAYDASHHGHVVLALNGVSPRAVDRHLLPALSANGSRREDISYLPVQEVDNEVLERAAGAEFVIAQSSALSAALLARGIGFVNAAMGLRYLGRAEALPFTPES